MTPEQIELVKSSWAKVVPIADTAAELFYGKLFNLDPSLKPLFKGDMVEQGRKLMKMINTAVNSLDRLDAILPRYKIGDLILAFRPPYFRCIGRDHWWTPLRYAWDEFQTFNLGQL